MKPKQESFTTSTPALLGVDVSFMLNLATLTGGGEINMPLSFCCGGERVDLNTLDAAALRLVVVTFLHLADAFDLVHLSILFAQADVTGVFLSTDDTNVFWLNDTAGVFLLTDVLEDFLLLDKVFLLFDFEMFLLLDKTGLFFLDETGVFLDEVDVFLLLVTEVTGVLSVANRVLVPDGFEVFLLHVTVDLFSFLHNGGDFTELSEWNLSGLLPSASTILLSNFVFNMDATEKLFDRFNVDNDLFAFGIFGFILASDFS